MERRRFTPSRKEYPRKIIWPIRNSKLDMRSYLKIRELRITANADERDFPHLREPWRTTIQRFNLDQELNLAAWVPVIDTFIKQGWGPPQKLSLVKIALFQAVALDLPQRGAATQLWTATVLLFADLSSGSYLLLKGASSDAEQLIAQLRTAPARLKAVISDTRREVRRLKLKKEFLSLCPAAEHAHLAELAFLSLI